MNSRPWMVQVVTPAGKKTEKEIVNPIFLKAMEYSTDEMWREIFYTAAYGKLPKGFIYKDNSIIHKVKSRTFRLEVPYDPQEAYIKCQEFFQQKGGIFSNRDYETVPTSVQDDKGPVEYTWNEIKRRKMRDVLFYNYVKDMSRQYSLNSQERRQLEDMINILNFMDIPASEVVINDNKIVDLKCLEFCNDRKFAITPSFLQYVKKTPTNSCPSESENSSLFIKSWIKFVDDCGVLKSNVNTIPVSNENTEESIVY